jgi:hypothetical protein
MTINNFTRDINKNPVSQQSKVAPLSENQASCPGRSRSKADLCDIMDRL